MEQGAFFNGANFSWTYSDPPNTTTSATPLSMRYCPADPGGHIDDGAYGSTNDATTSYGTCNGGWYVWSVNWGGFAGNGEVAPMDWDSTDENDD